MRSLHRDIPSFSLYGERSAAGHGESLHIEDIQSRSRKYLWKIATHRHAGLCQCVFVATGPVHVDLEDTARDLRGPAVIIIPAGAVHGFGFRADTEGYVLTVDLDRLLGAAAAAQQLPIQRLFAAGRILDLEHDAPFAARLHKHLRLLEEEFHQPDSSQTPICNWLACGVLAVAAHGIHVTAAPPGRSSAETRQLRSFRLLIEANYLKHWPVRRYAACLGISETSLNRLCRRVHGSTAFHIIQQRLALEARRRLTYVASHINNIAAELGFEDPAYFSRFFRRHSGLSPQEFRRRSSGGKVPAPILIVQ